MIIYFFYRLLSAILFPLILLYLLWRGLNNRRYLASIPQRLGFLDPGSQTLAGGVWLHAVSVGEVIAAVEMVKRMRSRFPGKPIFITVSTLSGRAIADDRLKPIVDGVFFAPLDLCWVVRRFLRLLRPRVLVVMETEIWPNLFREAKRFGCGLMIVNGRISDKAVLKYRRYHWFFRAVMEWPDLVLAQNSQALARFMELGAAGERVRDNGNLKYDFEVRGLEPPAPVRDLRERLKPRWIWIAASTMPAAIAGDPDEDDVVIDAFRRISAMQPDALLILVPRHPERFGIVAEKLEAAGVRYLRRSNLKGDEDLPLPAALLVDTMGELNSLFALADVVFIGGTLVHRGGHNILEPALWERAIVIGPHMENFPDIAELFRSRGAAVEVHKPTDLAESVRRLLEDPGWQRRLGATAKELAESKRGAADRALVALEELYRDSCPIPVPVLWRRVVLGPLTFVWSSGMWLDRWQKRKRLVRLKAPVLSVGGLTMGGSGKTPLVDHIAQMLSRDGKKVAILTRGYRRRKPGGTTILMPGQRAPVSKTGDEAQMLLRRSHSVIGIGANRARSGKLIEQRFQPHVILLDDGFQHWRLDRIADVVLLDALDPFGGGALFPLGRLREHVPALARASCIVISRASDPWPGLEREIRIVNQHAPIFYSRTIASGWISVDGSVVDKLPSEDVVAFCGLGNPASFWATLSEAGLKPRWQRAFADHKAYRMADVRRLAELAGDSILLTTEKDLFNLPPEAERVIGVGKLFSMQLRIVLTEQELFREYVTRLVGL